MHHPRNATVLVVCLALAVAPARLAAGWRDAIQLYSDDYGTCCPSVAASGLVVHLAFGNCHRVGCVLLYGRSPDGGRTWSDLAVIPSLGRYKFNPSIAAAGGEIYLTSFYADVGPNREISFSRSVDGGLTWAAPQRLTWNSGDSEYPSLAVAGVELHLAWQDDTSGTYDILYKRSTTAGSKWFDEQIIAPGLGEATRPRIAAAGREVYIVWQESAGGSAQIAFSRSRDGGRSWTAPRRLTDTLGESLVPAVAMAPGSLQVAWADDTPGNFEIFHRRSTDGGVTWSKAQRLSHTKDESTAPAIAVTGSQVHVVWSEGEWSSSDTLYRYSADGGTTWSDLVRLSPRGGSMPTIFAAGSEAHAAFVGWDELHWPWIFYRCKDYFTDDAGEPERP